MVRYDNRHKYSTLPCAFHCKWENTGCRGRMLKETRQIQNDRLHNLLRIEQANGLDRWRCYNRLYGRQNKYLECLYNSLRDIKNNFAPLVHALHLRHKNHYDWETMRDPNLAL